MNISSRQFILQATTVFAARTGCAFADSVPMPLVPKADLAGRLLLPQDDKWNRDVLGDAVDPWSDAIIASIGKGKPLHEDFGLIWKGQPQGIPYHVVSADQPRVRLNFKWPDESDAGPYPILPDVWIEGPIHLL